MNFGGHTKKWHLNDVKSLFQERDYGWVPIVNLRASKLHS